MLENHIRPFARQDAQTVDWIVEPGLAPYLETVERMETRVGDIITGNAPEAVWLVEHPALYTAGTSANPRDLLEARFPVHQSGRGGQFTYHGPGQRVAYAMLDLNQRGQDVRAYVQALEDWLIATLWDFHIRGEKRCDRVGVWVRRKNTAQGLPNGGIQIARASRANGNCSRDDKIAALGIRLRKWVSFHGISINVEPDLSHFEGIVPCGITEHGVTSFADLGLTTPMAEVDLSLKQNFERVFGPTRLMPSL